MSNNNSVLNTLLIFAGIILSLYTSFGILRKMDEIGSNVSSFMNHTHEGVGKKGRIVLRPMHSHSHDHEHEHVHS